MEAGLGGLAAGAGLSDSLAAGLLVAVKSQFLDGLPNYFTFVRLLTTTDLVEVVIAAMLLGLVLCAATSFLTLRRYLRV